VREGVGAFDHIPVFERLEAAHSGYPETFGDEQRSREAAPRK
jgi:hypothetical protein